MAKTFFTYEQQINKLQQEKELIIPDTDAAKLILEKLSYYSLIEGYKKLFKHTPSQKYIYGVTFDELVAFHAKGNCITKPIYIYFSSCKHLW